MPNLSSPLFLRTILWLVAAELVSFFGFLYPSVQTAGFFVIVFVALVLSVRRLEWGVAILLAELVVGSKGYLFQLDINGTALSIRMALWLIVLAVWLVKWRMWLPHVRLWITATSVRALLALGAFVLVGIGIGVLRGNSMSDVFFDANGWLFFLMLGPMLTVLESRDARGRIMSILLAAALVSSLEVLTLLFLFTHDASEFVSTVYRWLRVTGVAEVTRLDGNFFRIFLQSQLWALIAFFIALFEAVDRLDRWRRISWVMLAALFLASVVISLSRSFWVGGVVGILGMITFFLFENRRLVDLFRVFGILVFVGALTFGMLYSVVYFPYPRSTGVPALTDVLGDRSMSLNDAAGASRWNLLPQLWYAVKDHWIIGAGFGATVTYQSSDPRIVQSSARGSSNYTTFAFEWGFMDVWLKLGVFGLLAYCALLVSILSSLTARLPALALGLLVVAVVHFFSPYLNHPLGIGFVLFALGYAIYGERSAETIST